MATYRITLDAATAQLYEAVARCAELDTEQVLSDTLFQLAGLLSLEVLAEKREKSARR